MPIVAFSESVAVCQNLQFSYGVEAVHLEEPEFWARAGYSEGFKREWKSYFQEDWQPPHSSADAQWRCSKLKYFLYRRALQQVFDHVRAFKAGNAACASSFSAWSATV